MDHDYIDRNHVVDRYLMGRLSAEEADTFEEHYLSCQECLDRIDQAEALQRGLKRAVAEDAVRMAVARRAGLLSRLARSRGLGFALAGLAVVLLLPTLLTYREVVRHQGRELDRLGRDNAELARQSEAGRDQDGAARQALAEERTRLEREAARERDARTSLERELAEARRPRVNTPILSLSPERGGAADEDPTHRLRLPAEPGWVVLSLELDPGASGTYAASLLRGGKEVWKGEGLRPNELDSLVATVPTDLLRPGVYELKVTDAGGRAVARFAFKAVS
ncbi:MAG: hypothetical protein ACJ75H_07550 [Thermoanaerobaculia bacterium]